jgi:hypothetical protein
MANSATNYRAACVTAKANLAAAITSDAPEGGNTANSPLAQHHVVLIAELDKVINTIDQGNT